MPSGMAYKSLSFNDLGVVGEDDKEKGKKTFLSYIVREVDRTLLLVILW